MPMSEVFSIFFILTKTLLHKSPEWSSLVSGPGLNSSPLGSKNPGIFAWFNNNLSQPREHIEKQRHYFANKGPSSQGYGFPSSHVWMWELDCEESWALKNWCFWTVVLEKTLESPLACKEIQPVRSKGDHSSVFFGRNDTKAETPVLWPPHENGWLIGKDSDAGRDWGQQEKGMTEDEMAGWHHLLDGREPKWTPGVGDGQGDLGVAIHWVTKSRTQLSDWTELNWTEWDWIPWY